MYQNQIVPLYEQQLINFVPEKGVYTYSGRGRFLWLQRILFKVLSYLKCEYGYDRMTAKFAHFQTEDLVDLIMQQQDMVYQIYRKQVKYVLVGRDHYERLVKDTDFMSHIMFQFPHHYMSPRRMDYPTAFYGLRVVFIPWMEGIVAVPEMPSDRVLEAWN